MQRQDCVSWRCFFVLSPCRDSRAALQLISHIPIGWFTALPESKGTNMTLLCCKALRIRLLFLVLLATLAATGCSGSSVTVTGKVSYLDKPVKGGNVTFISTEGKRSVSGPIDEDGSYKLERVPSGEVKICVETESLNPAKQPRRPINAPPKDVTPPDGYKPPSQENTSRRYIKIPPEFADPEKTTKSHTITGGSQEYDIKLP